MKKTWKTFVVFAMLLALAALTAASAQAEGMTRIQLGTKESGEDGSWETTENGIRITKPGEYLISGTLEQGQILVDCTETGKVTLYLDGVTVHNAQGPAVRIGECSPRAVISLVDKSVNTLSNGTDLILDSGDEPDGVI